MKIGTTMNNELLLCDSSRRFKSGRNLSNAQVLPVTFAGDVDCGRASQITKLCRPAYVLVSASRD